MNHKRRWPCWGLASLWFLGGWWTGDVRFAAAFLTSLRGSVEAAGPDTGDLDQKYQELAELAEPLLAYGRVIEKVAEFVRPSVVHLEVHKHRPLEGTLVEESGSGVLIRVGSPPALKVLTNRHVIEGADQDDISVRLADERIFHPTRVWDDPATDVALLQIDLDDAPAARLGDSDLVHVGHLVLAMGSPFNHSGSVTLGIISAKHRRNLPLHNDKSGGRLINQDFLQTDAAINPGNSGGPLLNMRGEVIGINTAIASSGGGNEGVAFSVPINLVKRVAEDLLRGGQVSRAFIGVDLEPQFALSAARRLGLDRLRGALVTGVHPNTPAAQAGLQADDVILQLNSIEIEDQAHLIHVVSLTPVGKEVDVVIWRRKERKQLRLTVGDRRNFEQRLTDQQRQQRQKLQAILDQDAPTVELDPLGLRVREIEDPKAVESLGFGTGSRGFLVIAVDPRGLAADQVRPLDLIDQVERKAVTSVEDLQATLSKVDLSEGILVRVRRVSSGQPQTKVILVTP